jgi:hypothetical protein
MPGSVANCVIPTVGGHPLVFPFALCRAFTEVRTFAAQVNEYHDGTMQRRAQVASGRRTWKLMQRLTSAQVAALRTFMLTYPTTAFYFYNLVEGTYDATGAATLGRFKSRLSGDLTESIGMARTDLGVEIVEVA